jgi:amino-acid N-acetyltransferase
MEIHSEPLSKLDDTLSLLSGCGLPIADILPANSPVFFGIRSGSELIGVIGLELLGPDSLLRSLAVAEAYRKQQIAQRLVSFAEQYAASSGVNFLYLLTTTAASFFERLGYAQASRSDAPLAIRNTSQFSGLCPASSVLLKKKIARRPD